jgi:predicted acylesterase/phospholipase RssA
MKMNQQAEAHNAGDDALECDIVMAGGVTSGIIYPGAVAMISRRYRFRSIGGTSVGAIAAAVTAAAEYGRRSGANRDAFRLVGALPKTLGEVAADGHARLFHLFTPEPGTVPLLALVTPLFAQGGRIRQFARIVAATCSYWQIALPSLLTLLIGLVMIAAAPIFVLVTLPMTIASALVVWIASLALMLRRHWLPAWRDNGYGICTGLTSPGPGKGKEKNFEGLTHWMHRAVQEAAGRPLDKDPLTFGQLWSLQTPGGSEQAEISPHAVREIELAMIASDISRNRTIQLPFLETPSPLYVDLTTLSRYFPEAVVAWMKDSCGCYDKRVEKLPGVIRLPKPQDIPVVFGARLSLSFPVLLSALPLMTPDFSKGTNKKGFIALRKVWFSDGGLTSNFPIHFFDSPIPSRPTFCLNLIDADDEAPGVTADANPAMPGGTRDPIKPIAQPGSASRSAATRPVISEDRDPAPGDDVWGYISIAQGNQFILPPFTAFDKPGTGQGILSFAAALVNTARYWSDNQLLIAPGIRDRVVNIGLREDEGGLNLDMSPTVIADLDLRGRAAGMIIAARFDPAAATDPETGAANETIFANHRWVRFRAFMAAFEDASRRFAQSRRASDTAAEQRGETALEKMVDGLASEKLGYSTPAGARWYFKAATDKFEELSLWMARQTSNEPVATFDRARTYEDDAVHKPAGGAPRPLMRMRPRPLIDNDPRSEAADLPEQRS